MRSGLAWMMDEVTFAAKRANVVGGRGHATEPELTRNFAHRRNDTVLGLAGLDVIQNLLLS